MEKIKTRFRRLVYTVKHDWFRFENVLLVVALVCCLGWTYGAIVAMARNWELTEVLADKEYELAVVKLEVESLELENKYYASAEYQELAARAKMNKKAAGENVVYLSENSEYARDKHETVGTKSANEKTNFAQWMMFLLGE